MEIPFSVVDSATETGIFRHWISVFGASPPGPAGSMGEH
jgi:hypothetical protein